MSAPATTTNATPSTPARPSEKIGGVYIVPLKAFGDSRGWFFESYRHTWVSGVRQMVQGNVSFSKKGVLRGMHYHLKQADFWLVPSGHVRAALYDMRPGSPTRGASEMLDLGDTNRVGLYIPKGVAHGFCAMADSFMTYLVDEYYDNSDERGVRWNDPALGLAWGITDPIVSDRDQQNKLLADIAPGELPK
jgi:dTDP-4-dehydrorhamnose 3,5-epimerase